jgi:uncharacterized protein (DUF2141 family)
MKARTGLIAGAFAGLLAAGAPAVAAEACAGRPSANRLTVQVNGVRASQGQVAVTLYPDDSKRFLAPKGKLLRQRVKAVAPSTTACFYLPAAGTYAIAVYHDANADTDFNRNSLGMPTEGFGFSNDPSTRLGLPSFNSVRFTVRGGESRISIQMRYLR